METLQDPSTVSRPRGWVAWSLLLLTAYLLVHFVGWRRTLLNNEVWAFYEAGRPFSEQLQAIRDDLVHPPLMYLLERVWILAFGQSDNSAKALAMLINVPTFFLFTWLAGHVTPHWRLASFLFSNVYLRLASSPNQVRMYGLGLLLTVTAMVLWEKWRESPATRRLVAWTLVAVLLIYTHLFGALLLVAFVAANWLCGPRRWAFLAAGAVAGLSFLPWFLYVIPVYGSRGLEANVSWVPKRLDVALAQLLPGLLGPFPVDYGVGRTVVIVVAALFNLALLVWALQAAYRLWPPQRHMEAAARWFWAAALLVGVPLAMAFLFSVVKTPALHVRFVLGVLPAYWLLVVLLCQASGRIGRVLLYGVALPWVLVSIGATFAAEIKPSTARQAALAMASEHRPTDLVLCQGPCNQLYWEWTHRLGRTGRLEFLTSTVGPIRLSVLPPTSLDSVDLGGVDQVWFFYEGGPGAEPSRDFLSRNGFALKKQFPENRPFLLLFARPGVSTRHFSFPTVSPVFLQQLPSLTVSPRQIT